MGIVWVGCWWFIEITSRSVWWFGCGMNVYDDVRWRPFNRFSHFYVLHLRCHRIIRVIGYVYRMLRFNIDSNVCTLPNAHKKYKLFSWMSKREKKKKEAIWVKRENVLVSHRIHPSIRRIILINNLNYFVQSNTSIPFACFCSSQYLFSTIQFYCWCAFYFQ